MMLLFEPRGRRRLPLLWLIFAVLLGASGAAIASSDWWEDAIFYEVFVRSFYDSDGDGIGDLRGLTEKLDYLNDGDPATTSDLGVTALWLMPIAASPSYHGYDVTDAMRIEPDYGTMEDFRAFLTAAHSRGIRVIIDLVLNHTSSQHPWFVASRTPGSSFRDWYLWADLAPSFLGPWGQQVWHTTASGSYYGLFWSEMPDLNYRNPDVTIQAFDAARFWLDDVGVDGFRLDAIRHLIETGEVQENTPATHFWLKGFHAVSKGWNPEALLVGEIWDEPEAIVSYLNDEVDLAFEFSLAETVLNGLRASNARTIASALRKVLSIYPSGRYATFLSNHDQERVMTRLVRNEARARMAASILLTLPGTPFLYYGEEIGLTGTKPDERIRTPMPWNSAANGGFTAGTPWQPLEAGAEERNVALQSEDEDSLLSHYRRLIRARLASEALRTGTLTLVETDNRSVLGYLRRTSSETVLVLHHLAGRPSTGPVQLTLPGIAPGAYRGVSLVGEPLSSLQLVDAGDRASEFSLTLSGNQTIVLRISPEEGG